MSIQLRYEVFKMAQIVRKSSNLWKLSQVCCFSHNLSYFLNYILD